MPPHRRRLRRFVRLAPLAVAWLAAAAHAQLPTTAPAADAARVDALVADLSSDEWWTREAARAELVTIGGPALPTLRRLAAESDDPDLAVLADVAAREIARAGVVEPTRVTLDWPEATPQQVFEELARQAGTTVEFEEGVFATRSPAAFRADAEPFWAAFHRACVLWNVKLTTAGWRPGLRVESDDPARPWATRPAAVSGPFLVVLDQLDATTRIEAGDMAKAEGILMISFSVVPEPKLDLPWQSPRVQTERVADDAGADWGTQHSAFPSAARSGRQTAWLARTRLNRPIPSGERVTAWAGSAAIEVATAYQTVEIDDLSTWVGVPLARGGGEFTIEQLAPDGDGWQLTLAFRRGTLGPWEWKQLHHPQHRLRLTDARGRAWQYQDRAEPPQMSDGFDAARFTMHFAAPTGGAESDRPGPPVRLAWDIPSDAIVVPIEFGFEDFPVP